MTDHQGGLHGLTANEIAERAQLAPDIAAEVLDQEVSLGRLELNEGRYRFSRSGWLEIGRHVAVLAPGFLPAAKETGLVRW